jgi:steroid delta-isomerase-like uncharacterized protein
MDNSPASKIRVANRTLLGEGSADAIPDFFTPDYVLHLTDQDMTGHTVIRGFIGMIRRAFPDLQVEVEVLAEGGDRVAWQRVLRGTHQGDFMGFPASGKPLLWRDMVTSRLKDGLIAEEWAVTDLAERLLLTRKGSQTGA